jgi:hypothetical protein
LKKPNVIESLGFVYSVNPFQRDLFTLNINKLPGENKMKQPYIVIAQCTSISQVSGQPVTSITFIGVRDRKEYVTYVDISLHNCQHWSHIVNNPQHGFVLRNLKVTDKTTKSKKTIINADSKPIIEWQADLEEILADAELLWQDWDNKDNSDSFRKLFE